MRGCTRSQFIRRASVSFLIRMLRMLPCALLVLQLDVVANTPCEGCWLGSTVRPPCACRVCRMHCMLAVPCGRPDPFLMRVTNSVWPLCGHGLE